jgi:hypothetical protein
MKESPKREVSRSKVRDIRGEKISNDIAEASVALNTIIRSIAVTIQEKVVLENQVKNISHEADYVVDRIDDITKENQKMLMRLLLRYSACAYKKLLEQNVASVNNYRFTNKQAQKEFIYTNKRVSDNLYLEVARHQ